MSEDSIGDKIDYAGIFIYDFEPSTIRSAFGFCFCWFRETVDCKTDVSFTKAQFISVDHQGYLWFFQSFTILNKNIRQLVYLYMSHIRRKDGILLILI